MKPKKQNEEERYEEDKRDEAGKDYPYNFTVNIFSIALDIQY